MSLYTGLLSAFTQFRKALITSTFVMSVVCSYVSAGFSPAGHKHFMPSTRLPHF